MYKRQEHALRRGEGTLSNTGALVVKTGKYTGRSANDKFIVDTPAIHDDIAWGKVNRPMDKARFDAIYAKVTAYLQNKDVFIFDGFAGADPKYTKGFRIVNELDVYKRQSQQRPGHTGSHIRVSGQDTAQNAALVLPPQLLRHHRDQILRNGVIVDVVHQNTQF